jgi:hypothetical protein
MTFIGLLALGMGWYAPATGNWYIAIPSIKISTGLTLAHRCWIKAEPVYLRYVLTHGWRFMFIAIEVGLR